MSAAEMIRERLVVREVAPLSTDVMRISVAFDDGRPLPAWDPGDHIDIELGPGVTRQYSLCGARSDRKAWTVAVRLNRAGRGGSVFAHESLRAGDAVRVAGPRAKFVLEDAPHYVLIAGGIGITPILTMAEHLAELGAPFRLYYFDRGAERMVFAERLAVLGQAAVAVDRALDTTTTLAAVLADAPAEALVYACGPRRMLDELTVLVAADRLRVEDFAPAAAAPDEPVGSAADAEEFEVQLGVGGDVLPVPSDCSVLDVLLAAGIDVMWSCREGNCASCETPVLEGVPDHRDVILTDDEKDANDVMFPCVSRSLTPRLVLDC